MKIYLFKEIAAELLYEGGCEVVTDDFGYQRIVLQDKSRIQIHPYQQCRIWDTEDKSLNGVEIDSAHNFIIEVYGWEGASIAKGVVPQEVIDLLKRKEKALQAA